jgi:hypothetical protein
MEQSYASFAAKNRLIDDQTGDADGPNHRLQCTLCIPKPSLI